MLRQGLGRNLELKTISSVLKTKADSFTNQGLVEVCGKAANRGGGLVYIFDGPWKQVDLLEQLLDFTNNPAIRAEDDPGTARSKQTTLRGRWLRAMTATKSQGSEMCVTRGRKLY